MLKRMSKKIKDYFRMFALLGLILSLISVFCDWYIFETFSRDLLKGEWRFSIFGGWYSPMIKGNVLAKPGDLEFPFFLNLIFIFLEIISLYFLLFKDVGTTEELEPLKLFCHVNLAVLTFMGYYIMIFPVYYLIGNKFYFPFAIEVIDIGSSTFYYHYSVGIGYFLMIISYIMVFPYFFHYYFVFKTFENEKQGFQYEAERLINLNNDEIDIEKLIAEEELTLDLENHKSEVI